MARPDNVVTAEIETAANQTGAPDPASAARTTTDTPVTPVQPTTGTDAGVTHAEENATDERTPLLDKTNREENRREEERRRKATAAPTPEPSPAAKKEQEGPGKIRKIVNALNPLPTVKNGAKEIKDAMTGGARAPNAGYGGLFLEIGEGLAGFTKMFAGGSAKLAALIGFAPFGLAAMGIGKIIDKIKKKNEGNEGAEVRRANGNNTRDPDTTVERQEQQGGPTPGATHGVTPGNTAPVTTEMQQRRDSTAHIAEGTGGAGTRAGTGHGLEDTGVNRPRKPSQTETTTPVPSSRTDEDNVNMGTTAPTTRLTPGNTD